MRRRCYPFVEILNNKLTAPLGAALRKQGKRALLYKGSRYAALNNYLVLFLQMGSSAGADWPHDYI